MMSSLLPTTLFPRPSWSEVSRVTAVLRRETVGGALLLVATVIALVLANSPAADGYFAIRDLEFGPEVLHLHLSTGEWAADGLLAIFFFVAGLELKREFVAGDLRDPRRAALPVAINLGSPGAARGWAIPTATDIAFALAVLAVISTHLPAALRMFLLTLAVVDDLLAITIIAVFYTEQLEWVYLLLALVPLALFGLLVQHRTGSWWLLVPLALATWGLVHASGVHATVAGVLLAFTVPVRPRRTHGEDTQGPGMAERLEHRLRPLSAAVAVPIFAFFAAGVTIGGLSGLASALTDTVTLGIIAGLVVGKTVGILVASYLVARFTRASLDPELRWLDVVGLAMLAGIGFTVSLLIGELAFGIGSERDEYVKIGVLAGSLLAGLLATVILRARNRTYRRLCEAEERDSDHDGMPDVYEATVSPSGSQSG
jgi:NhaA family Na+:H+ antiporter